MQTSELNLNPRAKPAATWFYLHEAVKNAPLLDALWAVNFFLAVNAVTKKFRLLAPLKFLFIPPSLLATLPHTLALNHKEVVTRINRRGNTTHLDYFEHLCPPDAPEPEKKKLKHMEIVAGQLLSAGYEPISSQFLCTLIFLIQDPTSYQRLSKEIRTKFGSTHDIDTESVAHLRFLNACLMETLRITVIGAGGLPRISPGAVVDGHYIEKGINVQYGHFAFTRSPRFFRDPESFKPQRWLPQDHENWDDAFADDAREAFWPFRFVLPRRKLRAYKENHELIAARPAAGHEAVREWARHGAKPASSSPRFFSTLT